MTIDADGATAVRRAYEAVDRGDGPGLAALIARSARWIVPGRSPVAGTHDGRDAVLAFLGDLRARSGGTLRVDLEDIAAGATTAVALQRVRATRADRSLDVRMCVVYRARDGLLVEARYFVDDQAAYDAFWADDPRQPGV